MARTTQTARRTTGGNAPRPQIVYHRAGQWAPRMRLEALSRSPASVQAQVLELPASKVMRGLAVQKNGASVQDFAMPKPGDDDIVVKTVAVALNPMDWKLLHARHAKPGTVLGGDFSGVVVAVGKNVGGAHAVGDHVAGFVHGGVDSDGTAYGGAFAQYVRTPAALALPILPDTFAHEEAATFGCSLWAAALAICSSKGLGVKNAEQETWIYIHGGSSCTGQFAIQLAKAETYKVVTAASPDSFEHLKELGADAVFDLHDADVVEKVKAATGDCVRSALDCIGTREAQIASTAVIAPAGGKVAHLHDVIADATGRSNVERNYINVCSALGRGYTYATGEHLPAVPADREFMENWVKHHFIDFRNRGLIRPVPVEVWDGGLHAIPDGLEYLKEGHASGVKVVFRV